MGGTDLRRIDLLVAPEPYEPEEDEEDDPDTVMLWGGYSRWQMKNSRWISGGSNPNLVF